MHRRERSTSSYGRVILKISALKDRKLNITKLCLIDVKTNGALPCET